MEVYAQKTYQTFDTSPVQVRDIIINPVSVAFTTLMIALCPHVLTYLGMATVLLFPVTL